MQRCGCGGLQSVLPASSYCENSKPSLIYRHAYIITHGKERGTRPSSHDQRAEQDHISGLDLPMFEADRCKLDAFNECSRWRLTLK